MKNDELYNILLIHKNLYPKMQPVDVIKFLYQNEFGGGHLIKDHISSLSYLKKEYHCITQNNTTPLFIDIGNDFVRVNLCAIDNHKLSIEKLNEIFVKSANETLGNIESFIKKIEYTKLLVKNNFFSFNYNEFSKFLNEYEKQNYPMVSHSNIYKELYKPSYRIVNKKYIKEK